MHKFLIHYATDLVGVAVAEIRTGEEVEGVYMDSDKRVKVKSRSDIPIGHKIALTDMAVGASVLKYGVQVALVTQPIKTGEHVHVHNIKTARW